MTAPIRPLGAAVRRAALLHELTALLVDIGGQCWVSGPTAAALHGFDGYELGKPFHVVIERRRFVNRIGNVIHTTNQLELLDRVVVDGLPATSPTRTIIDLSPFLAAKRLTAVVDGATRDGLTSDDFLHRRLVALRSRGRRGINGLLQVLAGIDVTKGGHSWLERAFLELVAAARLPRPSTQAVVGQRGRKLIRVDCRFEGTDIVVELLGYSVHRSMMQMQNDSERMNRMILDGLRPLQFTYLDVVEHADDVEHAEDVVRLIREALDGKIDSAASALGGDVRTRS